MSYKTIKIIFQGLLLGVIVIIPFIRTNSLYFPFVSGKVYLFRFLVCIAFFFWSWIVLKDKQSGRSWREIFAPYKSILVIALVLFFLAQVFVSFFGVNPALSFFSSIERQDGVIQYGFWVLYFLMLVYAFREKKDWKLFFSVFITVATAVSIYAWISNQISVRLHGIFGNPSYLAAYLIFAIGFCFIMIERKFFSAQGGPASGWENKFVNILLWILPVFFGITIFFTQTRGVYLGLAAAIFLFCLLTVIFLRKQNPEGNFLASYGANKKLVISCAVILAVGLISVAGLFLARETDFVKNNGFLVRITEVANFWEVGSIRERLLTWEIALKAFQEKPIFGYGLENFMVAFNKYYDFRIGRGDPWFDHTHNQFLEYLATGGIVLVSFYIFLLGAVIYVIFKISKKSRLLSFILAGTYLAYIIQGFFLFDTLPVYLGLFPFLAFIVHSYNQESSEIAQKTKKEDKRQIKKWQKGALAGVALLCVIGIYTTVYDPYRANAAVLEFLGYSSYGYYGQALQYAEKSFAIKSPYTYWEVRKRAGWQLLNILDDDKKSFSGQEAENLSSLYDHMVPELEKFVEARPNDPQIYYVLPRIYRLGSEKLGKNDLQKSEDLLKQSFKYSDLRVEYYNEIAQVLLAEGKFAEGEVLLKDYLGRVQSFPYFPYLFLGHYYYVAEKYDLAFDNYEKARGADYNFCADDGEYSRYIDSADKTKNYQELVDMSLKFLEQKGPNADVYFNVALGYYYLPDLEKAKEFFSKALELNKDQYQQYASFFGL